MEELKQAPPSSIRAGDRRGVERPGLPVIDDQGKPFAEIWLRKAVPASAKPAGAKGVIQFPFLAESELLGVMQLLGEGARLSRPDHRQGRLHDAVRAPAGQRRSPGGQPVPRLLAPPARRQGQDGRELAAQAARDPECRVRRLEPSRTSSSCSPSPPRPGRPSMIHDAEKNTWRVAVPLSLAVKGESKPMTYPVSIIVVGVSEGA